jgi:nitroreductase
MAILNLTTDELLSTTRAVRKRMDFARPIERKVIEECLELALQAPTGSNAQTWRFVVVTDPAKRKALGDIYRKSFESYRSAPYAAGNIKGETEARNAQQQRVMSSADYLSQHMHEAPVLVIPCVMGRTDKAPVAAQAGTWGSIIPAAWSFMLACRSRGLGTSYTTLHLVYEQEAADLLGIPFERVMQTALIPVAYTMGTDFKPSMREPLEKVVHWEGW